MASLATRTAIMEGMPWRGISINPVTTGDSAITLVASDSGTICINKLASTTTYTLPACSAGKGKMFKFVCGVANNIVITSPTSTTLYGPTTLGTSDTITGAIGSSAEVVGDGTYWYVTNCYGTQSVA